MDLEAELLALAGDDSSGEESGLSPPTRKSPSPQGHSRARSSPKPEMASKGVAKRIKRVHRRNDDSDDEPTP